MLRNHQDNPLTLLNAQNLTEHMETLRQQRALQEQLLSSSRAIEMSVYVGRAFVQLQVAHDTMVGEIFCYAVFRNAEMLRQARLNGFRAAARGASQKTADGNPQSLAGLDIVVSGKIGIAQKKHAGSNRGAISFA